MNLSSHGSEDLTALQDTPRSKVQASKERKKIPSISLGLPELPSGLRQTRPFVYNSKHRPDFTLGMLFWREAVYYLCPLAPLLHKDHKQWVTEVFTECVPEDNAREGRTSSAENQGAGKRQRGAGPGEKRWELIYTRSVVPDWNRPMKSGLIAFAITVTTSYNNIVPFIAG